MAHFVSHRSRATATLDASQMSRFHNAVAQRREGNE
jgi:hypothetical protein